MNIKVKDNDLGTCTVDSVEDIDKDAQYLIKALCVLQIMVLNSKENPEKHKELVKVLKETTAKANAIFNEDFKDVNIKEVKYDATANFN